MNPQAVPNAFAAFYLLTPAQRVAAAVRLVQLLKRSRKRAAVRLVRSWGRRWGYDGGRARDVEDQALYLTRIVQWLEDRYGLRVEQVPQGLRDHIRRS